MFGAARRRRRRRRRRRLAASASAAAADDAAAAAACKKKERKIGKKEEDEDKRQHPVLVFFCFTRSDQKTVFVSLETKPEILKGKVSDRFARLKKSVSLFSNDIFLPI